MRWGRSIDDGDGMQRARWTRPSCLIMLALAVLLVGAIAFLASGVLLRTPNPASVTKETTTYGTDVPSQKPAGR
jgi:hypothetical protein